jgi:hypothetical protein
MKSVVIETNVIAVANELAGQADVDCIAACIDALLIAQKKRKVVIDSGQLLFQEYFKYANRSGQPRTGDAFIKWLWDNQANIKRVESVNITQRTSDPTNFQEFPSDSSLNQFDPSDRKFVAVALASKRSPIILNAVDSDWWEFRDQFKANGVKVKFLCPQMMK